MGNSSIAGQKYLSQLLCGGTGSNAGNEAIFPVDMIIRGDDAITEWVIQMGAAHSLCGDGQYGGKHQCQNQGHRHRQLKNFLHFFHLLPCFLCGISLS